MMKKSILLLIFLPLFFCSCSNDDEVKKDYRERNYFKGVVDGENFLVGDKLTPRTDFHVIGRIHGPQDENFIPSTEFSIPLSFKNGKLIYIGLYLDKLKPGEYKVTKPYPERWSLHYNSLYAGKKGYEGIYLPHEDSPATITLTSVIFGKTVDPMYTGTIEGVLYNEDSSDSIVIDKSTFHIQGDKT